MVDDLLANPAWIAAITPLILGVLGVVYARGRSSKEEVPEPKPEPFLCAFQELDRTAVSELTRKVADLELNVRILMDRTNRN